MVGWMLFSVGLFAREFWSRYRGDLRLLKSDKDALVAVTTDPRDRGKLELSLEEILHNAETRRRRSLGRLRLAIRLGPSLGLMGTLIPMADALQGLADGNLPALASNMVTAFAATVIGLTVSVVAYLMSAIRENWTRSDTDSLNFAAERLLSQASAHQVVRGAS